MNKLIIFDFNRTLFDPEKNKLIDGALELLSAAKARGFLLVLLAQALPSRRELISQLGIETFFEEIILVEHKRPHMLDDIATRYNADLSHSYVVGDRAQGEIALGYKAGWHTIWVRSGRFANELPNGFTPAATVHTLDAVAAHLN